MDNIHLALVLHDQSGHYSKYVGTTLLSVFENMSVYNHSSICVHIFHDDTLTKENKEKFEELVYGYNNKIVFHKITYPLKKIGRKDKLLLTCIFHFHLYIKKVNSTKMLS